MLSRPRRGVTGGVVVVTENPGGPSSKNFLYAKKELRTRKKTRYLQ